MGLPFMSQLGKHLQHLTLERVVRTGHADLSGEISEVGSVS